MGKLEHGLKRRRKKMIGVERWQMGTRLPIAWGLYLRTMGAIEGP